MNPGTLWLNSILQYEEWMGARGFLQRVELLTLPLKLQAMMLEQVLKPKTTQAE